MGNVTSKSPNTVKTTSGKPEPPLSTIVLKMIPRICPHTDGAKLIAEYIVQEIKTNVKSDTANSIRYDIDPVEIPKRPQNATVRIRGEEQAPGIDFVAALKKWKQAVQSNAKWDHKQKIRAQFKAYAVHRPLRAKEEPPVMSESHFHKYKGYDYYFDVWSNIHYGYVGLSVCFDERTLIAGANAAQIVTEGTKGLDTKDDDTAIKIGFSLYKKYGKYAEGLTAQDVLDALDAVDAMLDMPSSKQVHWCWNEENNDKISK